MTALASPVAGQYFRGVNIAGAEFGMNTLPGVVNTHYTFHSETTFRYFAARNLQVIRFPLQWERLQPSLGGPLDPSYLGLLKTTIGWAREAGCVVIPEIHNFGRYSFHEDGRLFQYVIDQAYGGTVRVSRGDLADLWVRLSNEFANEPAVYAYDLMNEPHDVTGWKEISQHVLTAIRNNADRKLVMIPGDGWSSANRWVATHGASPWISDPADNFMYEAHLYFDYDESGTYRRSYDQELQLNPRLATIGSTRVAGFLNWCRTNGVRCFLGEFGVPDTDPRWRDVLDDLLKALDTAGISAAYWAAGEWWGSYPLSVQPSYEFTVDRPQMRTLMAHLGPKAFLSVSAASGAGAVFAPGSLMKGYGAGLAAARASAGALPWPVSLNGVAVEVTDSTGVMRNAELSFVSPEQINYRISAEAAPGRAMVEVKWEGAAVGRGTYTIEPVAPTLFTATGDARGPAAGVIVRIQPDGARVYESTVARNRDGQPIPQPIEFGEDRLFISLYGTGFRDAVSSSEVTLTAGGEPLAISYSGAQPETPGLDQVNAELPRSLAGAGEVELVFRVNGKRANPVTLVFR
jgi:endoglucanase